MAQITRHRVGQLLQGLFKILPTAPDGLRAGEALDRLSKAVPPTPYEQETYDSGGVKRFDKVVRYATIDCVKAGWLTKDKGLWSVTDEGREALQKYPDPEEFSRQAAKLYRVWRAAKSGTEVPETSGESPPDSPPGTDKSADVTREEAEEQAWKEIEQYLGSMPPFEFQKMVADLLRGMGYHVIWEAPPGKDGGVDITASSDPLGTRPPHIKVQVKRTNTAVSTDTVKSFVAVLDSQDVGVFVGLSGFTKDADVFARQHSKQRITLVDLRQFFSLWVEFYSRLTDNARRRFPLSPIYFLTPQE